MRCQKLKNQRIASLLALLVAATSLACDQKPKAEPKQEKAAESPQPSPAPKQAPPAFYERKYKGSAEVIASETNESATSQGITGRAPTPKQSPAQSPGKPPEEPPALPQVAALHLHFSGPNFERVMGSCKLDEQPHQLEGFREDETVRLQLSPKAGSPPLKSFAGAGILKLQAGAEAEVLEGSLQVGRLDSHASYQLRIQLEAVQP